MSINILLGVFGTSFTRESTKRQTENQPFYTYISGLYNVLRRILKMECFKDYEFRILFDDLDVEFNLNENSDCESLLTLIRVSKEFNNDPILGQNSQIIIFMRDDVRRRLSGFASDCNKIFGSYEFRLNWYEGSNTPEYKLRIRELVNKRISSNFEKRNLRYNKADPWISYIDEYKPVPKNSNSLFKGILDYTFYRPRDFINVFLPLENQNGYTLPLRIKDLKSLIKSYSSKIYEEFNDELSIQFSLEEREAIKHLLSNLVLTTTSESGSSSMSYDDIKKLIKAPLNESILEILYDYDVIGAVDKVGDVHFHFRESYPTIPIREWRFCVPKIIRLYFDRSTTISL